MTPDERQLISGLFDRLRQTGLPEKDRDADQLIRDYLRQNPDAGYMLVQSVIVQEMALEQTQQRVEALEEQVRQLDRSRPQQSSGGFLGGLFGGGQSRPVASSVPPAGRQSTSFGQGAGAPMRPSPWGQQAGPAQAPAGGGFMRSAMATAAGVAGGMLVANAISGMMGGGSAHAATGGAGNSSAAGQNSGDTGYAGQVDGMSEDQMDPGNFDGGGGGDWGGGDE